MASNMFSPIKKEPSEGQQGKDQSSGGDRGKMEVKSEKDRQKHKHLHTFSFFHGKTESSISITCQWAGTILEALKTSKIFNGLCSKNEGKDVVIVRKAPNNADVATHFPCRLIKENEELTIKFSPGNTTGLEPAEKLSEDENLVTFYIDRIGGKNCMSRPILKNTKNRDISFLCVYARVEETVEEALQRDGRFAETVFKDGETLGCIDDKKTVEMCGLVGKDVNGQRFRLNMKQRAKAKPSDSPKKATSGSDITAQAVGPSQAQGESTPKSVKSAAAMSPMNKQGESTPRSVRSAHARPFSPYPGKPKSTEELLNILRSQFEGLVRHMKEREELQAKGEEKQVLELLREEFGKNTKVFWGVKNMRNLVEMSRSVCHIIFNDDFQGTGFLLFGNFILTNAHVVELEDGNIVNADKILVNFHHEEIYIEKELNLPVKEIVCGSYLDEEKLFLDYALLELAENETSKMPQPLLSQYSPPIDSGGVCIIGHPERGEKGLDLCSIIQRKQRQSVIEEKGNINIYYLQNSDFSIVLKDNQVMTYDTSFFHGSSGSPVFDQRGQVVAMHTGGCGYTQFGKSIIEYATSLRPILENLISQVVDKQRLDILKKFLEEARTSDALHPFIAEFIRHLLTLWNQHFLNALWTVITTEESDAESRVRCWMNIVQNMPLDIQQKLKGLLFQNLTESQKCECILYQLL